MKLTVEDAIGVYEAIDGMFASGTKAGGLAISYKLARIKRELRNEYDLFIEQREELINKFGTVIDDGKNIRIEKEDLPAYKEGIDEILAVELEDVNISEIKLSDLTGDLPGKYIDGLYPIIKAEE